jgi:hypothetical protein
MQAGNQAALDALLLSHVAVQQRESRELHLQPLALYLDIQEEKLFR